MKKYIIPLFLMAILCLATSCNSIEKQVAQYEKLRAEKDAEGLRVFLAELGNDKRYKLFEQIESITAIGDETCQHILVDFGYAPSFVDFCQLISSESDDELTAKISELYPDLGVEDNIDRDKLYDGGTALQYALFTKKDRTALQLMKNGACLPCGGSKFYSPTYLTAANNNINSAQWLLDTKKGDWEYTAPDGTNLLHAAVLSENPEMLEMAFSSGLVKDNMLGGKTLEEFIKTRVSGQVQEEMLDVFAKNQL